MADIMVTGINNYNLKLYLFPAHLQELRLLLALEQLHLLINPQNNSLYVAAESPGGMAFAEYNRELNRQEIYMYLENKLIYVFSA